MPALFCLALNRALRQIHHRLPPRAQVVAYLDDIYVVRDPEEVQYALDMTRQILRHTCHIDVHFRKFAAWGPTPTRCTAGLVALSPDAWINDTPDVADRGIKFLGAPFESDEHIDAHRARLAAER